MVQCQCDGSIQRPILTVLSVAHRRREILSESHQPALVRSIEDVRRGRSQLRVGFRTYGGHLLVGVVSMALLAFVLALCSEADAFVAASLTMVPLLPRLVFLVVGPAVDVKLVAMQAGLFGRAFALRFAPLTLIVTTTVATVVGAVLL